MATDVMTSGGINNSSIERDCDVSGLGIPGDKEIGNQPTTWTMPEPLQAVVGGNQQKKTHRRKPSKKKRKWKPYSKMSWEERKALEEKEKSKAVRMREEMKEKGRPVAPYNTTQFLMDEHDPYDNSEFEPGYNSSRVTTGGTDDGESYSDDQDEMNGSSASKDGDEAEASLEGYTDSPHMVPEFITQDFSETYERVHEESLHTMKREELLAEHMDLEKKFTALQEQLAKTKRSHVIKVHALEARIDELGKENETLQSNIERLMNGNEMPKPGSKSESRMSTSDNEEIFEESKTIVKLEALVDGDVMERR